MPASLESAAAPPRAPRRDAVRNNRRVLEAARAVFAERGPQASMEDVARHAGVGVGTIYRRFPSKDALLDSIAELFVADLDQAAAEALADDDAGRGLQTFLEFVGAFNAEKRRYASALVDRSGDESVSAATAEKVIQLTHKAVAAGALAPQVTGEDIKSLIVALRGVVAHDNQSWRRFLRIHLTGLRTQS